MRIIQTLLLLVGLSALAHAMDVLEQPVDVNTFSPFMANNHRKLHKSIKELQVQVAQQTKQREEQFTGSIVRIDFPFLIDVDNIISKGEESEIYLAENVNDKKKYIARVLLERSLSNSCPMKKVVNEVQVLEFLKLYKASYLENKRPILIMDYIPGINLTDSLVSGKPIILRAVIAKAILEAAQNFYRLGAFHRDIKPSNMHVDVVDNWPVVRFVDFGHSCRIENADKEFCGSPFMQAPEAFSKSRPKYDYGQEMFSVGKAMAFFLSSNDAEEHYSKMSRHEWCRHKQGFESCVKCSTVEFEAACDDLLIKRFFKAYEQHQSVLYKFIKELHDTIRWLTEPIASERPSPDQVDALIKNLNDLESPLKLEPKKKISNLDLSKVPSFLHSKSPKESPKTAITPPVDRQRQSLGRNSEGRKSSSPKLKSPESASGKPSTPATPPSSERQKQSTGSESNKSPRIRTSPKSPQKNS